MKNIKGVQLFRSAMKNVPFKPKIRKTSNQIDLKWPWNYDSSEEDENSDQDSDKNSLYYDRLPKDAFEDRKNDFD